MTPTERKALERERKRALGLTPHEIWCHPDDWPQIKQLIDKLAKERNDG